LRTLLICQLRLDQKEKQATDFVKRMGTIDGGYTDEALAEFRQLIWKNKNLLENSRDIVDVLRKLNLDRANRCADFYIYIFLCVHRRGQS
jgi:hypothetical protein